VTQLLGPRRGIDKFASFHSILKSFPLQPLRPHNGPAIQPGRDSAISTSIISTSCRRPHWLGKTRLSRSKDASAMQVEVEICLVIMILYQSMQMISRVCSPESSLAKLRKRSLGSGQSCNLQVGDVHVNEIGGHKLGHRVLDLGVLNQLSFRVAHILRRIPPFDCGIFAQCIAGADLVNGA
jgi:hypothetical protein